MPEAKRPAKPPAKPPLIDQPGPWGQSYRDGLDPRWGYAFQRFVAKLGPDDISDLWEIMRDCFDQGARAQGADPNLLPVNPYNAPSPSPKDKL